MDPAAQNLLDSVEWSSLHHAYGEASDVPDDLRALLSPDKSDREAAYDALYSNIFHQATRYEATAYAVPYLLKIVENPSTPARASVISLLVDLAVGIPSTFLPQGVDPVAWRQHVNKIQAPEYEAEYYAEQDELVHQARDEHQRKMREYVRRAGLERQRKDSKHELAAYDAVCAGVPVFRKCLEDKDLQVRAFAAYALAWFPGEKAAAGGRDQSSSAVLQRALYREGEDSMVLASAMIALGLLHGSWKDAGAVAEGVDDDLIARLREYGGGTRHPLVQFAAAVALVRLQRHRQEDVAVLAGVLIDRSFPPPTGGPGSDELGFPFCEGDLFRYSGKVLSTLNMADYREVMSTVLAAIPRSKSIGELVEVVLEIAFGPRPEDSDERPLESLSEIQLQTVTALTEMEEEHWEWTGLGGIIEEWNVPGGSRDECREYLGLPVGEGSE